MPYDLFISYAHIDNEPLPQGKNGWVDYFRSTIEKRLKVFGGRPVNIWRDPNLKRMTFFDEEITTALRESEIFVSVISPSYLNSEWCMRELETFIDHWKTKQGKYKVPPVVKVIKIPVDRKRYPQPLQRMLEFPFFIQDTETEKILDFWLEDPETKMKFLRTLDEVAQEITKHLGDRITGRELNREGGETNGKGRIYLAETTSDQQMPRDQLRSELVGRGFTVVPLTALSQDGDAIKQQLTEELNQCSASIHPIGKWYGTIPAKVEKSVVELQVEQALQQCQGNGFRCVVWVPKGIEPQEPRQLQFLATIRKQISGHRGVTLLEPEKLEDLKNDLREILQPKPIRPVSISPPTRLNFYILCKPGDLQALEPLEDFFNRHQLEVRLSESGEEDAEIPDSQDKHSSEDKAREKEDYHQRCLNECDGAIIYYGTGNVYWVDSMMTQMKRTPGAGREKPLPIVAVYVGGPINRSKERFHSHDAIVVQATESFEETKLQEFLNAVKEQHGSSNKQ